jgi:hypothetical protein
MQRQVMAAFTEAAEPVEPGDFGFILPWPYVLETGAQYFRHGVLPRAGGWDDQEEDWKTDIRTLTIIRDYVEAQRKKS